MENSNEEEEAEQLAAQKRHHTYKTNKYYLAGFVRL